MNIDVKEKRTGNTPIIWAAKNGHLKIVQLLLKYGADITIRNYDNETAIDVAKPGVRTALLQSVERAGCTPRHLLQAAWQGNIDVVQRLLVSFSEHHAYVHEYTSLSISITYTLLDFILELK